MQITREYIVSEIEKLIQLGRTALISERKTAPNVIGLGEYLEGSNYKTFISQLKVFVPRFLKEHPLYNDITKLIDSFYTVSATKTILQHLETIKADEFFLEQFDESIDVKADNEKVKHVSVANSKKIFIVHGRDSDSLEKVELFLYQIGCDPVVVMNEPSGGLVLIDKIERCAEEVDFAIVIYTACDEGRLKGSEKLQGRARQNVVFEHGYLIAKLGRENVVALVEEGVETPGDVQGVVYVSMADDDWRQQIIKEMQFVGIDVDIIRVSTGRIK